MCETFWQRLYILRSTAGAVLSQIEDKLRRTNCSGLKAQKNLARVNKHPSVRAPKTKKKGGIHVIANGGCGLGRFKETRKNKCTLL